MDLIGKDAQSPSGVVMVPKLSEGTNKFKSSRLAGANNNIVMDKF